MITTDLLFFIGSCIVLVVGAEFLVKSLTKIALYFNISDFMVGFMVVAIATSIPELFIGITSALNGNPELSMGNVIGSNIIDLTLIVGIMALLRKGVKIETVAVRIDALYMFLISLLPMILVLMDGSLNKVDGFVLVAVFFLYLVKVLSQRGRFHEESFDKKPHRSEMLKYSVMAVLAILTLIVSAESLVRYATNMSNDLVSPSILVGLFLVSIGTTLPELIFGSGAILMKHKYMAFGDIIGSVVANTTLVLGVVALISPVPLEPNLLLFLTSNFFMVVVAFLFATFVDVEKHILWQEGVALIMLYILFVIVILNIRVLEISYGIVN
jgi:cation:H+ antiporter